jgi:eukaryotic-like serine/threonine-protein kinase
MALTSGTKLGPYEIQSPLGAGGMGEVYRARDTRLDRTVAVKILPAHLSDNPEARQRFEREAKTISSLNHPNICVLHDIGNESGTAYLVMEYVQGETLEARLQKGALPLKQALEVGVQICDALEKAHRAGIVHRDLKPGNIMLTPSGAKLLDFGLAKPAAALTTRLSSQGNLTPSTPTMNMSVLAAKPDPLTQQGSIVGTFQFMAPEVLQGQEADARSDIFSFGCVLYEMITGKRAFEGKSQISVASAILEKEPEPITKAQPMAPPALDHVLQGCLAKEPEARWQSASDIGRELRWIATSGSSVSPAPEIPLRAKRNPWLERGLWGALAALLLATVLWLVLRPHATEPTLRSYLPPPENMGFDFTGDFSGPPAVAPDGSAIVFSARTAKERDALWLRPLDELAAKKLEGTDGGYFPFWSPDGKYIGFFADGKLKKTPSTGGPVTVLADTPNARGGTWTPDNVILYEPDYRDSLWRVSANGGTPERLTKFEGNKHTTHRWPKILPDGKHFLFFATNHSGTSEQGVYFGSLADGSYKHLVDTDSQGEYANGYLLYHLQSQLMALKFDPSTGKVSGDPMMVANFVEYDAGTWHTTFAASQNGLLIYEPGSKALGTSLAFIDRTGKNVGSVGDRGFYKGSGVFSPDGKKLAVSMGDPQADIWIFDLERGSRTRLTFGGATHQAPTWSADGQRVAYVKQFGTTLMAGTTICARLANGSGQEEVLMRNDPNGEARTLLFPQWSPDGKYLLHMEQNGPEGRLFALPLQGDAKAIPLVTPQTPQAKIVEYRLSRDGRWLAYSSAETGREEIYVTHFPSGAGRWQVSQAGGTFPSWRADGKEMYFVGLDGSLHAATVNSSGEEFEVAGVTALFPYALTAPLGDPYDPAPDGQRFVFNALPEGAPTPLVLVTNWAGELKK